VLYSPVHDATFWSLGAAGARRVVDLWAARSTALGARPDVAYVLPFENRGVEVGATVTHPHGQIYAFDTVPPVPRAELDHGDVVAGLGPDAAGGRLVAVHGGWRAWVPAAALSPYELVLAPDTPVPDLPALDDGGRDGLAATLVDVLARLDVLARGPMPYLLWIHQRPFAPGPWPRAWLHLHVRAHLRAPGVARYVAAGELGSGVHVNPVAPERAAADLRAAEP
jgi:UDPglucose--hexose-1-phosphate uridylyltransferase